MTQTTAVVRVWDADEAVTRLFTAHYRPLVRLATRATHRGRSPRSPSNAGLAIQATTGLHDLPLSPWAGLGVLTAWAGGALLAGCALLLLRDA